MLVQAARVVHQQSGLFEGIDGQAVQVFLPDADLAQPLRQPDPGDQVFQQSNELFCVGACIGLRPGVRKRARQQLRIQLGGSSEIEAHDRRQHERVCQAVRQVETRSKRIGQGVDRCNGGVGEGLTGQACAKQRLLTCLEVSTVFNAAREAASEQLQGLARQHLGERIVVDRDRGVGLDGMHHGVDTGRRGDVRRQLQCQFGIENRQVGNQNRRDDAFLLFVADRDDGHRRDLGAGTGRRWHQRQRQTASPDLVDAIGSCQGLGVRCGQQCHEFGHVHG